MEAEAECIFGAHLAALPSLQSLSLKSSNSIPGSAVVHLASTLLQLCTLRLQCPCDPATDMVAAAVMAQDQASADIRHKDLTKDLAGAWAEADVQAVRQAAHQQLGPGPAGLPHVHLIMEVEPAQGMQDDVRVALF